jgi:hypothetical protein
MLTGLLRRWRAPAIDSVDTLKAFLDRRASLVAQKSIIGYCQVKTRLPLHELTIEKQFADAFEIARWEAFVAVLSDLVVVTEGALRHAASSRAEDLPGALARVFGEILRAHPVPGHRPQGWADLVEELRLRLARAQLAAPATIRAISANSAERLYAALPIHESLREADKPAIVANVEFLMVGLAHEFESQFDTAALALDLLAPAPA